VHKTDEVARNPKAMAAAIMADPAVARAAQAALEAREVTRPKAPPMPRAEEDPQEVADEARYQQLMANRADLMRANTNIREVLRRGVHEDDRPVIASDAAGIRQALEALEALVSGQSIDQEFLDLLNEGR
jgi:hypothetical protein